MADNERVAASSEDAPLPDMVDLAAGVSDWNVADDCATYERLLDIRRSAGMFSDGQSKAMIDHHGIRHDTDIGA